MFIWHHFVLMEFWNRKQELLQIKKQIGKRSLGYVTGRRRVGKTALLVKACEELGGFYHQAVEGTAQQQLLHLAEEIGQALPLFREIVPKSWGEFFALLSREALPSLIVFDEFPYWVQGDSTLPSLLQKWVDHELPKKKSSLFVSGSSQSMLFSHFLRQNVPLYGRAQIHLSLEPMSYEWFCRVMKYPVDDPDSFLRFSLVGGIPHYWKLMPSGDVIEQADLLYFAPGALLSEEPVQMLRDEGVTGSISKAILDLVGRGVSKPSELASRLGIPHGNLSRPLALLLELSFLKREFPFGESARTTKKILYRVEDPVLSFYYGTFLPFRAQWPGMNKEEKRTLLKQHACRQWEIFCRRCLPGSGRYWEKEVEIDLVTRQGQEGYLIAECKWANLDKKEESRLVENLKRKFEQAALSQKMKGKKVSFRIFSHRDLTSLAAM